MSTQPLSTGIFSMPAGQAAPPATASATPTPAAPIAQTATQTAPPTLTAPATAATTQPAAGQAQPAQQPQAQQQAPQQPAATPMALDETRVVEEQMSLEALRNNPTPSAVVQAQMLYVEKLKREAALLAEQNAALLAREKEREDAERARLETERAAAEQAHKESVSQARLKLEANLRAALDGAKTIAPDVIDDAGINKLAANFRADLDKAGFDEAQLAEVARKMEDSAELIVRASKGAAAARADLERRNLVKAIDMLKPNIGTPFAVSGGFTGQQQPPPTATVFGAPISASSSSTMFGATTPWQQPQPTPAAAGQSIETGMVAASKTPSIGGMFAGVLPSAGKRSASEINGTDGGMKRSMVSETVPIAAPQTQQASAPDVDFSKADWMQQVIAKSLIDGEGMPSEKALRHGGYGIEQKTLASANGGTFVQKHRVPRMNTPYTGPITMEQLNPVGFKFCVDRIAEVFAGKTSRPQLRSIAEHLEVAAAFPREAANYNQNRNLLPPQLLAMGTANFGF